MANPEVPSATQSLQSVGNPDSRTDVDWSVLPTGERGWRRFLDSLDGRLADDRDERNFIEFKSDVDLNDAEHRVKVVKFILRAANRSPEVAKKRFGGSAVLLLGVGVGDGGVTGIEGFEAKDLEQFVVRFTGPNGPRWDYQRLPVGAGRDVIALHVDPPSGNPHPCHGSLTLKDKQGKDRSVLQDGTFYVRADGQTRPMTGAEIAALYDRRPVARPPVEVEVTVPAGATVFSVSDSVRDTYIKTVRERLLAARAPGDDFADDRSPEAYETEVGDWAKAVEDRWPQFVTDVRSVTPVLVIHLNNLTKTFLSNVQLRLTLDTSVEVSLFDDEFDEDTRHIRGRLPREPTSWGAHRVFRSLAPAPDGPDGIYLPPVEPRWLGIHKNDESTTIAIDVGDLRPFEETSVAPAIVCVTLADTGAEVPTEINATWTLTAKDHHEVYEGPTVVPVSDEYDWDRLALAVLGIDVD